ncbi:MAG: XamI family restriction endonuclease [bacterium]|nr:XamI family restriction endonuclease [bacterium]
MALPPPRWTAAQLGTAASEATEDFRQQRLAESRKTYLAQIDRYRREVEELFAATDDLRDIARMRTELLAGAERLEAIRYLTGPPISADDLRVIAGTPLSPVRLAAEPGIGDRIVETIMQLIDRDRFPWIEEGRGPTMDERAAAVGATSTLLAASRLQTMRRNESRTEQENAVKERLRAGGLEEVAPQRIDSLRDAPAAGQFSGESLFGTRKADIVIGLFDGRVMPIECKVSNSSTNSIKRLNNDAQVKAVNWISEFGHRSTVPAAVLSGVYQVRHLVQAQDAGLTLFWTHDIEALVAFVLGTGETAG